MDAPENVVISRTCVSCGSPLADNARFCGYCRTPVQDSAEPATELPSGVERIEWTPALLHPRPAPTWRLAGLAHHQRALVAITLLVWVFNVPFAVLGGVVGAVAGTLSGAFGDLVYLDRLPVFGEHLDFVGFHLGGVAGALVGAVLGCAVGTLTGLLAPLLLMGGLDPIDMLVVAVAEIIAAVVIGYLYTAYAVGFERKRLHAAGARRPSRREAELLNPTLLSCMRDLRLVAQPDLLVDGRAVPASFAYTRHIVISADLLDESTYNPEKLAGVLSHQLVHWNNGDATAVQFIHGIALPLYLGYSILTAIPRIVGHNFVRVLIWLFGWPIMASVRFILVPLQASGVRAAEYRADRGALLAGHAAGLGSALVDQGLVDQAHDDQAHDDQALVGQSGTVDGNRNGWDEAVCAMHPAGELRLERLERDHHHTDSTPADSTHADPAGDPTHAGNGRHDARTGG